MLFTLPFLAILLVIAFIDLRSFRIPDPLVIALFGLGALKMVLEGSYMSSLSGFLALFGFFFLLHLFFPKGMGFGDVKLAGGIGLFLGFRLGVLSAFLAFLSGGLVGMVLVVLRRKALKDPLPFGPFLALGALLGLFFGERMLSWYFEVFFP
ncbi:prepilin peptidase [Candidatus Caldatribacterium sp. SIUC1]|uniref:prepilin peptidase n=1 Tax=Candidatus Caldatribacterium sp. SIUC1 TaxID=3418365 RepID=UPI003F6923E2